MECTDQVKKDYEQKKGTHTTRVTTQTQPLVLVADAFAAALGAVPTEDWCRTWADGRTIILRRVSKFSRQSSRKRDILYTYSVVDFGLSLSI